MLISITKGLATTIVRLINRLVLIPLLWLIEPFWKIRITHINTGRIGHLTANTSFYLARREMHGPEPRTYRFFYGFNPCNATLYRLWTQFLNIVDSKFLSRWYNMDNVFLEETPYFKGLPFFSNEFEEAQHAPALKLPPEDEDRGRQLCEEMGIGENDWFMCFQARDAAYHRKRMGIDETKPHRNANIETYIDAARYVVEKGGVAIRVGQDVDAELPDLGTDRIVDYSTHHRSDFGDIYLLAKAEFVLATSGIGSVPPLFHKSVVLVNYLPPRPWPVRRDSLCVPKLLRDRDSGQLITFKEMANLGMFEYHTHTTSFRWDEPTTYGNAGLDPVDNEPDDLLGVTKDIIDRMEGLSVDPEAIELQEMFTDRIMGNLPGYREYGPRLAPRFALKYRHLIEN